MARCNDWGTPMTQSYVVAFFLAIAALFATISAYQQSHQAHSFETHGHP
jgi:hypothetical protein